MSPTKNPPPEWLKTAVKKGTKKRTSTQTPREPEPVPEWVLAIDPGRTFGWSLFHKGVLIDSGHCSFTAWVKGKISPQGLRHGMKLPPDPSEFDGVSGAVLVGEKPIYYSQGKDRTDHVASPNDLIGLGITLGELVSLYRRKVDVVELVTPKEWKGSVDKDLCHERIKETLKPDEVFPKNHNARDAVGIGLWKVNRYKRGR